MNLIPPTPFNRQVNAKVGYGGLSEAIDVYSCAKESWIMPAEGNNV